MASSGTPMARRTWLGSVAPVALQTLHAAGVESHAAG